MSTKRFFTIGLFFVACCSFIACGKKKPGTKIIFHADSELAALLPGLADAQTAQQTYAILQHLETAREAWCASPGKAAGLLRDLTDLEKAAFTRGDLALRATLGCAAWYAMTDRTPEVDFAYARHHADRTLDKELQCVSVGFLQPYILATKFNCGSLTVVDLSFRTLRLHTLMMPLLTAETFSGLDSAIAAFEKSAGVTLAELCRDYTLVRCKIELMAFSEKYRGRLDARLALAPIHRYIPEKNTTATVFNVSNAADPNFTSAKEFAALRQNLSQSTTPIVAVYHQAESTNFGVYEFKDGALRKICADAFVVARAGRYSNDGCKYYPATSSSYKNYFDATAANAADNLPCKL